MGEREVEERITGVAAIAEDGGIIALPKPCRHHHLFAIAWFAGAALHRCPEQGFVTNRRRYVDRTEALRIATDAGQLLGEPRGQLYSEDVW